MLSYKCADSAIFFPCYLLNQFSERKPWRMLMSWETWDQASGQPLVSVGIWWSACESGTNHRLFSVLIWPLDMATLCISLSCQSRGYRLENLKLLGVGFCSCTGRGQGSGSDAWEIQIMCMGKTAARLYEGRVSFAKEKCTSCTEGFWKESGPRERGQWRTGNRCAIHLRFLHRLLHFSWFGHFLVCVSARARFWNQWRPVFWYLDPRLFGSSSPNLPALLMNEFPRGPMG